MNPQEKNISLSRFRGSVEAHDAETIAVWREASHKAHAQAMIELATYAERMAAQTGFGKDPAESFPGVPPVADGVGS